MTTDIAGVLAMVDANSFSTVGASLGSPVYWIDKLVVALLLLGFGQWAKVSLERSKSNLALKNEMAKQRIPIIASTWSRVYRFETNNNDLVAAFVAAMQKQLDGTQDDDEIARLRDEAIAGLKPEFDEVAREADELLRLLLEQRFWLGEWLYERYHEYCDLVNRRCSCVLASEFSQVQEMDGALLAIRQSIDTYL